MIFGDAKAMKLNKKQDFRMHPMVTGEYADLQSSYDIS